MSRSIVCGIDQSAEARRAAEFAIRLAEALDADPILVHAVDDSTQFPYANSVLRERGRRHAALASDELAAELDPARDAEGRVVWGPPGEALARVAGETDALLVVVGSRGHGPLRSALLGSTSHATLEAVDRPVVVVPPTAAHEAYSARVIVCGLDGSPASEYALATAAELSDRLDRELMVVAVEKSPSMAAIPAAGVTPPIDLPVAQRGTAEARAEHAEREFGDRLALRTRVEVGDLATQIVAAAEEEKAELIVVGRDAANTLGEILRGSVAARLRRRAPCPVLMVPEGASLGG